MPSWSLLWRSMDIIEDEVHFFLSFKVDIYKKIINIIIKEPIGVSKK